MTELPEIASIFKRDQQGMALPPPEDLRQWTDMDLVREAWCHERGIATIVAELERRGLKIHQTFKFAHDAPVWRLTRIPGHVQVG
jgi:hypothetical protein